MTIINKCQSTDDCPNSWDCMNNVCRNQTNDKKIVYVQIAVCSISMFLLTVSSYSINSKGSKGLVGYKILIGLIVLIGIILMGLMVNYSDVNILDSYTHSKIITDSILWGIGLVFIRRVGNPTINSSNISQHLYDCIYGSIAVYIIKISSLYFDRYVLKEFDKMNISKYY